ncbi:MAG: CoA-binding protein [Candidatus Korarchaeum sp.]|nr:CoA-binding protein [Candidatus Korarchaeum sp.]
MVVASFLNKDNVVAVVGVSKSPEKWGYRLYKFFKGYYRRTYPINPGADEIDGDRVYPNLSSLPELPDVVNLVVPPAVAREVVKEAISLGVRRVWFQPGSEDEEAIRLCQEAGVEVVWGACLMESISKGGGGFIPPPVMSPGGSGSR